MSLASLFRASLLSAVALIALVSRGPAAQPVPPGWKAGIATTDITPTAALWMSGYGARDHPAEGKLHPLFIKVLALEAADGKRAIVMGSDLLGIPQSIYNRTCETLKQRHGLERSQIMLHASHSHCTPVLRSALYDAYIAMPDSQHPVIERYSAELEAKIAETVEKAFAALAPARLASGQGITRFAVNRRNNPEPAVAKLRDQNALKGPSDHSVPVLTVTSPEGALKAVVFGYACHNTTLSFYQWAGDYAGFAQIALERNHPGATALFFSGCGADQNPIPRREVFMAQRYGEMLAAAVEEVLLQRPKPLAPTLKTAHEFVTLKFGDEPTLAELEELAKVPAGKPHTTQTKWAARLLAELKAGRKLARTYPYPVQAWQLGGEQLWIALGGEVVIDYALRFKSEFGLRTWVAGYTNDVMAYIPSARVLAEDTPPRAPGRSGYEGNTSMYVYGQPAHRWADDTEQMIAEGVRKVVAEVKK
ncbi:MAG: neutral/alkaline non-lysosomal ceramidase N-terminal domain-containing protein [Verrucomicrobiota bacterium]